MQNLSIVIPHYEKQRTLSIVQDELTFQVHPDDEIIIVDDHSPGGVPDFDCPCTKVVSPRKRTPHIYRLNTLRNLGVETASHDAVILLDPDCIPNKKFLDNARRLFDPSIIYGGAIDKVNESPKTWKYELGSIRPDARGLEDFWYDGSFDISGGCMMFSKYRTKLFGWFNTDYDGSWGPDDTDFVMRCHHSGIRQRYTPSMKVYHIWHPKDHHKGPAVDANVKLYHDNTVGYRDRFNYLTKFNPAAGVMVISVMRPELIDQCLRGIFLTNMPLKVRLISNGNGNSYKEALKPWRSRWTVDIAKHRRRWPAVIRNDSMRWANRKQLKYLLMIDDDAVPKQGSIIKLVNVLEENPDIYAVCGYQDNARSNNAARLGGNWVGGKIKHEPLEPGWVYSDVVTGGFTLTRVKPLILWDEEYETGLNDYDWSNTITEAGWKMASCGDAGMWHQWLFTPEGRRVYKSPPEYNQLRYDRERHLRMDQRFFDKWGYSVFGDRRQ